MTESLWEKCIENLALLLNDSDVDMWLKPLDAVVDESTQTLTLYAPNKFVLEEVQKKLLQTVELVVKKVEPDLSVKLQVGVPKTMFDPKTPKTEEDKYTSQLNPEFIFDNYVEGSSNQIAASSALGVAKSPDGRFNPLMIYGSTGLGKSHLMHAIGNYVRQHQPRKKIIYQTAEQFVAEMVNAISNKRVEAFKKHYRSVDLLLVDDVQFIAGKDKSQEEFFHLFNTLLETKSQVVLTCDKYPKDVENLEERLKSRFGAGLSVAIEPPDLETRVAILKRKAQHVHFELPDEVAFFIAEKVRSHVRDLEGALNSVYAMAQFTNKPASIDLVKSALRDILNSQRRQISVENIQKVVANYYGIKITDLKSKSRKASLAKPRQVAMAIAKQLTTLSTPEIGEAFERDHSTVIHAVKKVEEQRKNDTRFNTDFPYLLSTPVFPPLPLPASPARPSHPFQRFSSTV